MNDFGQILNSKFALLKKESVCDDRIDVELVNGKLRKMHL